MTFLMKRLGFLEMLIMIARKKASPDYFKEDGIMKLYKDNYDCFCIFKYVKLWNISFRKILS
jgi:hypothetical protein